MFVSRIQNTSFGLKFTKEADKFFQRSQDYIADKAIQSGNDDDVIKNNLNRTAIEYSFGENYILDLIRDKKKYTFLLNFKPVHKANLQDILNGKAWEVLAKKLDIFTFNKK